MDKRATPEVVRQARAYGLSVDVYTKVLHPHLIATREFPGVDIDRIHYKLRALRRSSIKGNK